MLVRVEGAQLDFLFTVAEFGQTVDHLAQMNLYRRMIDTVVHSVVMYGVGINLRVVGRHRSVGEVEGLHALTCREQGSISVGGSLYHFVFGREQVGYILAGLGVGEDGDPFLLDEHAGLSYYAFGVGRERVGRIDNLVDDIFHRVTAQVIRVMDELGGVVSFELEHEHEVVAEIVLTQTESGRQITLYISSGYTSRQTHLRLVVEPYVIQRFVECKLFLTFFYLQITVVEEGVTGFEHLKRVGLALDECHLEMAVGGGGERHIAAMYGVAVEDKHSAGYRHRTQMKECTTGEAHGVRTHEINARCYSIVHRQGDIRRRSRCVVVGELRVHIARDDGKVFARRERLSGAVLGETQLKEQRKMLGFHFFFEGLAQYGTGLRQRDGIMILVGFVDGFTAYDSAHGEGIFSGFEVCPVLYQFAM